LTSTASNTRKSAAAKENTLQTVKRNLLEKPDWMGLSAARPLKMTFPPAEEMEKICKRRKTKIADEQRTARAQPASGFHPAINSRRRTGQRGSSASLQHTDDASIRIGSNIHQTQETPGLGSKKRSSPDTSQIASTESMLLDKFDGGTLLVDQIRDAEEALRPTDGQHPALPKTSDQGKNRHVFADFERESKFESSRFLPGWAHSWSPNEQSEIDTGRALPTLDQLRDSKTFDELKARSAPRSSKELKLPVAQKEVAEDYYNVYAPSSVTNGRRLHPSYDYLTGAVAGDSYQNPKLAHCELDEKFRATHADTTQLSNGFWPNYAFQSVSQADCNVADSGHRSNSREHADPVRRRDTTGERNMVDFTAADEPSCQRRLVDVHPTRPLFTLEQQVSDEAMAKSRTDVPQCSPVDLRMTAASNMTTFSRMKSSQSWAISPTKPRQHSRYLNDILPLSSIRGDVATLKSSLRYAPRSEMESLGVRSITARNRNQQHGIIETHSRNDSDVIPLETAIPRQSQLVVLQDIPQTWHLQQNDQTSDRAPSRLSCTGTAEDRHAIRNEAWMESVLPAFNEFKNTFRFDPILRGRRANSKVASPPKALGTEEMIRLNDLAWRPLSPRIVHNKITADSCYSSVNSVLHQAKDLPQPPPIIMAEPSVTDFLTQMSPMEGRLDHRLGSNLGLRQCCPKRSEPCRST
jgi:hypothetical protein